MIIEQIPYKNLYKWSKSEHNARLSYYFADKTCKIITYDIQPEPEFPYLMDIIWFATINNVYTTNGYSGYIPEIINTEYKNECNYRIDK